MTPPGLHIPAEVAPSQLCSTITPCPHPYSPALPKINHFTPLSTSSLRESRCHHHLQLHCHRGGRLCLHVPGQPVRLCRDSGGEQRPPSPLAAPLCWPGRTPRVTPLSFVSPACPVSRHCGLGGGLGRAVRDGADPRRGPWETMTVNCRLLAGGFCPPQELLIWDRFSPLSTCSCCGKIAALLRLVLCFSLLK